MVILVLVGFLNVAGAGQEGFKKEQLRFERVRAAVRDKEETLKSLFAEKSLAWPPREIFLRAFKQEKTLELWARGSLAEGFILIKSYGICALSGGLGPKRREGDLQIPEGFYLAKLFNPHSAYYLSLGLDYPNASDRKLGDAESPGGEIFIHGSCVTIGCLPMTDDGIKELYLAAVEAREAGQEKIPVHIFPCRLTEDGLRLLRALLEGNPAPAGSLPLKEAFNGEDLSAFWRNLKEGYDLFEENKTIPAVSVDPATGKYKF